MCSSSITNSVLHLSLLMAGLVVEEKNRWPMLAALELLDGELGALGLGPFLKLSGPTCGGSSFSLASPWRSPEENRRRRKFIPDPKESLKFENEILAMGRVAAHFAEMETKRY